MAYVYRRPFDYRRPTPQWLLLRPDLDVAATAPALALSGRTAGVKYDRAISATAASLLVPGQASTAVIGRAITATAPALSLASQVSVVDAARGIQATAAALILTPQHASASTPIDDPTFIYRTVPVLMPQVRQGMYRAGYSVRRVGVAAFFPSVNNSGLISADRGQLTLSGQTATVGFNESLRLWVLQEAVRNALLKRRLLFREGVSTRPWDDRIVQFTVPTQNLTAYAGALTLSGQQSTVFVSRNIAAQVTSLSLARPAAAVRLGKSISAAAASLTLSGQSSRIGTGRTVAGVEETLALAGQASDTDLDKSIAAGASALVLSGLTASFGNNRNIAASVRVMTLSPHTATAKLEKAVAAFTAALSLQAQASSASLAGQTVANAAELTLSGETADTQFGRLVEAAFAELSLDSQQVLVEGTQAVIVQVGRRTVRVRARNSTITVH